MDTLHIHVTGASGSGTTTLGRALADALAIPHHDTDDYYWTPTAPAFQVTRPAADRLRLMREMFLDRDRWVLSGSCDDWAREIVPLFDVVVFLRTPTDERLRRLQDREFRRNGEAILPGGAQHADSRFFLEWAAHYEDGSREGRTLQRHLAWLATLSCRVLRLDGGQPVGEMVATVLRSIGQSLGHPASGSAR